MSNIIFPPPGFIHLILFAVKLRFYFHSIQILSKVFSSLKILFFPSLIHSHCKCRKEHCKRAFGKGLTIFFNLVSEVPRLEEE